MADYIELLAAHDRLEAECDRLKAGVAELRGALIELVAFYSRDPGRTAISYGAGAPIYERARIVLAKHAPEKEPQS